MFASVWPQHLQHLPQKLIDPEQTEGGQREAIKLAVKIFNSRQNEVFNAVVGQILPQYLPQTICSLLYVKNRQILGDDADFLSMHQVAQGKPLLCVRYSL